MSGPFYPYPDRGTLTMSVPLFIVGALIYGQRFGRPSRRAALVAIAVLGALPLWQFSRSWYFSRFRPEAPFMYITRDHRAVIDSLAARASTSDVLLAEPDDLLWIAPEHPGRFYVGHFFLTVSYLAKNERLQRALAEPDSLPAVLDSAGAQWLYVKSTRDRERIARVPGLTTVLETAPGTLFRVARPGA